jgi:hypothetical protein
MAVGLAVGVALGIALVALGQPSQAAPTAAALETVWTAEVLEASTRSNAFEIGAFDSGDFQITIDQGSAVNTATIRTDRSNDGYNWATGQTLVTNNAADATSMITGTLVGQYNTIYATLANTNPVTITVLVWKK